VNEESEARWGSPVHPSYRVHVPQPLDRLQDIPHDALQLAGGDAHLAVVPEGFPVRPLKEEAQLTVDDREAHEGDDEGRPALHVVRRLQQNNGRLSIREQGYLNVGGRSEEGKGSGMNENFGIQSAERAFWT
jgi:hypothetical protein